MYKEVLGFFLLHCSNLYVNPIFWDTFQQKNK